MVRTYGMTETAGGCVYDGAPLPGVRVQVSAGDEGDDGEIRRGGPVLALGYRLRPLDTADRFADGWFRTGDVGRLTADGRLTVTGRRDDVVQVRGTAVGVAAVEGVLAAVPGVRECAVVAVDGGDDGSRLVAFVVPEAGPTPGDDLVDRLRATVRRQLGPAAVPRTVHPLHSLPVLPGGKIDRSALRRRATAP